MTLERDAMGLEPLYYWTKNPAVHGKTVLELLKQGVPRKLCRAGFWSYMLGGSVQEPFTLIEDVRSLPPGCTLADGKIVRVWQPSFKIGDWTRESAQEAFTVALEKSVKGQMVAAGGTPCAFLSGGIDSGALVAVMRNVLGKDADIRTCCVVHEDPRTDERQWARLTAAQNHTRHEEFMLTGDMFSRLVGPALEAYDQPSVDGINSYIASKFAAEAGFQNIVSGEGGDELCAGYGQYAKPRQAYALARRLGVLRGSVPAKAAGRLLTRWTSAEKFKKLGQLLASEYDPYFLTRRQFDPDWIARLVGERLGASPDLAALYAEMQSAMGTDVDFGDDTVNRCSWMETRHNLLSMYVRDGVQTSAPFGLNVLTPIMSKEVVELLFTIPGQFKCDPAMSKPLLVRAAKGGLPEVCVQKKKQGFALPFDQYFRAGLKDQLAAFVEDGGMGLFDRDEIGKIWKSYLAGKTSWMRIWQPFVLDFWLHRNSISW